VKLSFLPFHLRAGLWGEGQAELYLRSKGFKIIGRRMKVGLRDEIDLVAREQETLVFVEVKTRKSERYGRPFESVDRRKRHALSRAAVRYLQRLKQPVNFRFDVVEIVGGPDGELPVVRHIENAFLLDRCYVLPW
jgi:putative endonuclease